MTIQTFFLRKALSIVPYKVINWISEINTINGVNKSFAVDSYQKFLKSKNFKLRKIGTIEEFKTLPLTDKSNYISLNSLGDISLKSNPLSYYKSSGYSGTPTYWSQNVADFKNFIKYKNLNLDLVFNISETKTLIISTFALSSWITGQQVLAGLFKIAENNPNVTIFSCGMVIDEPLDVIQKFGNNYEQIILFFYPLTFKAFMDKAQEQNIDLKKFNIKIILGAEGVTYQWVKHYERMLKKDNDNSFRIFSAYGAADSGIGIAAEQVISLVMKDYCFNNNNFLEELTGSSEMPLHFFQYNPLNQYIESIDGHLVFTKLKQNPLIRYNLHDRAVIITPDKVRATFKKFNVNIKEILKSHKSSFLNLPFFVVYGRDDGTIILNGANIYINSFKEALSQPNIISYHTGKFQVDTLIQDDMFQNYKVTVELKKDVVPSNAIKEEFRATIIKFLMEKDKGYANAYHKPYARKDICIVEFLEFNNSNIKHKYN